MSGVILGGAIGFVIWLTIIGAVEVWFEITDWIDAKIAAAFEREDQP